MATVKQPLARASGEIASGGPSHVVTPPVQGGPTPTGGPGSQPDFASALTGASRDAFVALNALFTSYGLGSLAPKIFQYIQNGYSADTISLLLQDTPEYKTRFAGNEIRRKAGMAVLSPADYLNTEASYRQILASAGLPKGFYDQPSDFTNWIGSDVSPSEIQSRVQLATAATSQANPYVKAQLSALYGVDDNQIAAYFLDQQRALPLLQKQEQTAQLGAEAVRRGLVADRQRLEDYVTSGFSLSQASQGFQQVAQELPTLQALSARFGVTFGQGQEEGAVFGTSATDATARQGLINSERSLFAQNGGSAASGLNAGYRAT